MRFCLPPPSRPLPRVCRRRQVPGPVGRERTQVPAEANAAGRRHRPGLAPHQQRAGHCHRRRCAASPRLPPLNPFPACPSLSRTPGIFFRFSGHPFASGFTSDARRPAAVCRSLPMCVACVCSAGQLAIWDGVVPPKLPGPAVDVDALNGIKKGGQEGAAAAAGAAADGVSVLEGGGGGGGGGTAAGASDDYDRDDSFLADSGACQPGSLLVWFGHRRAATPSTAVLFHAFTSIPISARNPAGSPCPLLQAPSPALAAAAAAPLPASPPLTCRSLRTRSSRGPPRWVRARRPATATAAAAGLPPPAVDACRARHSCPSRPAAAASRSACPDSQGPPASRPNLPRLAAGDSGRCYLAYTPLGCITLKQEEDHNVVEVGASECWRQPVCVQAAHG
jgi:hypothetical protein